MEENQLLELRNKIVQKAQQLAMSGNGSPAERLQVLMGSIQAGTANFEVLNAAYEIAGTLEGDDEQLSALLDVLYEVDARIAANVPNTDTGTADNEQSVHNEGEDNHQ